MSFTVKDLQECIFNGVSFMPKLAVKHLPTEEPRIVLTNGLLVLSIYAPISDALIERIQERFFFSDDKLFYGVMEIDAGGYVKNVYKTNTNSTNCHSSFYLPPTDLTIATIHVDRDQIKHDHLFVIEFIGDKHVTTDPRVTNALIKLHNNSPCTVVVGPDIIAVANYGENGGCKYTLYDVSKIEEKIGVIRNGKHEVGELTKVENSIAQYVTPDGRIELKDGSMVEARVVDDNHFLLFRVDPNNIFASELWLVDAKTGLRVVKDEEGNIVTKSSKSYDVKVNTLKRKVTLPVPVTTLEKRHRYYTIDLSNGKIVSIDAGADISRCIGIYYATAEDAAAALDALRGYSLDYVNYE